MKTLAHCIANSVECISGMTVLPETETVWYDQHNREVERTRTNNTCIWGMVEMGAFIVVGICFFVMLLYLLISYPAALVMQCRSLPKRSTITAETLNDSSMMEMQKQGSSNRIANQNNQVPVNNQRPSNNKIANLNYPNVRNGQVMPEEYGTPNYFGQPAVVSYPGQPQVVVVQ